MAEPSLGAPCPCGSGLTYIRCCGYLDQRIWDESAPGRLSEKLTDPRWHHLVDAEPRCEFQGQLVPPGILALDLSDDRRWRDIARVVTGQKSAEEARVIAGRNELKKTAWRETQIVDQSGCADEVLAFVRAVYRELAEPFYQCSLRSIESPHILRYAVSSYYRPHADSDQFNPESHRWEKTLDRDLSLLVYLDDDYEGGELVFPNFDFELRPSAGLLLMFPSDFRYLHGVRPVSRGIRHAIVSWCALQGGRGARPAT